MPSDLPPAATLPRHVWCFAVWAWRPWKRWVIAASLVLTAYVESPVMIGATRQPVSIDGKLTLMMSFPEPFFSPLRYWYEESRFVMDFYNTQTEYIPQMLGCKTPRYKFSTGARRRQAISN